MKKSLFIILLTTKCLQTVFAQPTITSITPTSGPVGTTITISGTNFSSTPTNNIVFFGATKATVSSASITQIDVTVPAGATYQPITVTTNNLTAYSEQSFITTFVCGTSINTNSFAPKTNDSTSKYPYSISIGDIDGDGKSDIVAANYVSNTVSVLRNTSTSGIISFALKMDFATGSGPWYASVGDVNGDGKLDIAVANYYSNKVSIFKNTSTSGNISFAAKIDFATGVGPDSPVICDIDADGKPDLVIANHNSNTISILKNTGTGGAISFATKVDYTSGTLPEGVAINDLNGDGKPDLVVTNTSDSTVSVFKNTSVSGIISFASQVIFSTGQGPYAVSIGDLDADGKPDLCVVNNYSSTVSVLRNNSTIGTISFLPKIDYPTSGSSFNLSLGDLDGDGKLEIAVANGSASTVSVYENTCTSGVISFAPKMDFATGSYPISPSIADIDGDGKPDIAITNNSAKTVSVLRNINCLGAGINNYSNENTIIIYPNPATTRLIITHITSKTTIRLYDVIGQLAIEIETENDAMLDTSQLTPGLYTIVTVSKNDTTFNKILITK